MREILFRGKRIDTDEWVYGNLICSKNYAIGSQQFPLERPTVVDPETVGQYTGLKDINGNRIFEGDVIRGTFHGYEETAIVSWRGTEFVFPIWDMKRYEVIGTSYDSPTRINTSKAKMIRFLLNGCDISFFAEAPADITLEQLLKQTDRIVHDRCACGIRSLREDEIDLELDLSITYGDVKKMNDYVCCRIEPLSDNGG